MPTGSGKTWVQGLLAKYYCNQGKRVTIIEPTTLLTIQASEKIGLVHNKVTIVSIMDYYKYGTNDDIIIIDEYDSIMTKYPYY